MTIPLSIPPQRRCTKCGTEYPATLEYFNAQKGGKYGLSSWCKTCIKAYRNSEEFKAKKRAYDHNYYHNTPGRKEHVLELLKQPKYQEKQREWKKTPKGHASQLASYKKKVQKPARRAYERATNKKWRLTEHGKRKAKEYAHSRRARKMNAGGHYTAADIELQIKAQTDKKGRLRCWWCGKEIPKGTIYHVDHVVPLIKGGSNGPENIVISHGKCNMSKHDKTPGQFMGRLF